MTWLFKTFTSGNYIAWALETKKKKRKVCVYCVFWYAISILKSLINRKKKYRKKRNKISLLMTKWFGKQGKKSVECAGTKYKGETWRVLSEVKNKQSEQFLWGDSLKRQVDGLLMFLRVSNCLFDVGLMSVVMSHV